MALLLVALLLAAPLAQAADARVRLTEAEGVWNGLSELTLAPGASEFVVWVPEGARVQGVRALEGGDIAGWTSFGSNAIRVQAANATGVEVAWDARAQPLQGFHVVAPREYDRLLLWIDPPAGLVPESPDVAFEQPAPEAGYRAQVQGVEAGESIVVRFVPPGRVGELPVLASVAVLSLVVLAGATAYHRVRPPLQGRAPEKFLDHLSELQARLLPPVVVFVLLNVVYFTAGLRQVRVGSWWALAPTFGVDASLAARAFASFAERLVPAGVQLVVLRPADAVLAQVEMALLLAFATTLPLLVYELAKFLGPALLPDERRVTLTILPLVSGLFFAGALVGYLLIAPLMIETLYDYAPTVGAAPLLGVLDLVSFAALVVGAMGLAFELPVIMYALSRLGVVRAATFRRYLRHAALGILLVSGILTPDPSVVSQLLLAVPIVSLYALGIAVAYVGERKAPRPAEAPAPA